MVEVTYEQMKAQQEACSRFNGATGILERVSGICGHLRYNEAKTEEEKMAILEFKKPFDMMRINITMRDLDQIDWIYREVKPLIYGKNPKLTLDYILSHPHHGEIF